MDAAITKNPPEWIDRSVFWPHNDLFLNSADNFGGRERSNLEWCNPKYNTLLSCLLDLYGEQGIRELHTIVINKDQLTKFSKSVLATGTLSINKQKLLNFLKKFNLVIVKDLKACLKLFEKFREYAINQGKNKITISSNSFHEGLPNIIDAPMRRIACDWVRTRVEHCLETSKFAQLLHFYDKKWKGFPSLRNPYQQIEILVRGDQYILTDDDQALYKTYFSQYNLITHRVIEYVNQNIKKGNFAAKLYYDPAITFQHLMEPKCKEDLKLVQEELAAACEDLFAKANGNMEFAKPIPPKRSLNMQRRNSTSSSVASNDGSFILRKSDVDSVSEYGDFDEDDRVSTMSSASKQSVSKSSKIYQTSTPLDTSSLRTLNNQQLEKKIEIPANKRRSRSPSPSTSQNSNINKRCRLQDEATSPIPSDNFSWQPGQRTHMLENMCLEITNFSQSQRQTQENWERILALQANTISQQSDLIKFVVDKFTGVLQETNKTLKENCVAYDKVNSNLLKLTQAFENATKKTVEQTVKKDAISICTQTTEEEVAENISDQISLEVNISNKTSCENISDLVSLEVNNSNDITKEDDIFGQPSQVNNSNDITKEDDISGQASLVKKDALNDANVQNGSIGSLNCFDNKVDSQETIDNDDTADKECTYDRCVIS